MRAETDTRSLASMNLPSGFSFVMSADAAELWTPEGEVIHFGGCYRVEDVEIVASEHHRHHSELVRAREPDLHTLLSEVLGATDWTTERKEAFACDFLYALCREVEEIRAVDEEWRDGSDPGGDAVRAGWSK